MDLIEISKANIDIGKGESKTALQRKVEMTEIEEKIKELQQYIYKQ